MPGVSLAVGEHRGCASGPRVAVVRPVVLSGWETPRRCGSTTRKRVEDVVHLDRGGNQPWRDEGA
jgi:hypothetical protein